MTLKSQISVIGCGWFGLPLAEHLVENGYKIHGSTTSNSKIKELKSKHIEPFLIELNAPEIKGNLCNFLKGSKTMVINIPPGLRLNPNKNHVSEITLLIDAAKKAEIANIIYISSTSVFNDDDAIPIVTDATRPNAISKGAKQLVEIENLLINNPSFNTTILRFGGLFDSNRHPAKYLSGKTNIANPNAPINLIHKEDCIGIVTQIIKNNVWNVALNAVYPLHTSKKLYYTAYCKQHNLDKPTFNFLEKSKGKIIDSSNLVQLLNYSFKVAP